jgi:hypothetical protein
VIYRYSRHKNTEEKKSPADYNQPLARFQFAKADDGDTATTVLTSEARQWGDQTCDGNREQRHAAAWQWMMGLIERGNDSGIEHFG